MLNGSLFLQCLTQQGRDELWHPSSSPGDRHGQVGGCWPELEQGTGAQQLWEAFMGKTEKKPKCPLLEDVGV